MDYRRATRHKQPQKHLQPRDTQHAPSYTTRSAIAVCKTCSTRASRDWPYTRMQLVNLQNGSMPSSSDTHHYLPCCIISPALAGCAQGWGQYGRQYSASMAANTVHFKMTGSAPDSPIFGIFPISSVVKTTSQSEIRLGR